MTNLLKIGQVAEILGISVNQVYVLKATGKLPYVQIERSVRFDERDLEKFIQDRKQAAR